MNLKDKKVLIAMPCGSGSMSSLMVSSLLHLRKPCSCSFLIIDQQRTDKCRTFFAKQCLAGGFDYLMMIDDDNPIPDNTLELMLKDDKDVVITPILTRVARPGKSHDLCAYYKEDRDVGDGKTLAYYNFITKFRDEGPLHKIDSGGCGCILIKRKVLEKLDKEYPDGIFQYSDITVNGQRRTMSEDAEFGERVCKSGFEMWLDDRIIPIHLGNQIQLQWQSGT